MGEVLVFFCFCYKNNELFKIYAEKAIQCVKILLPESPCVHDCCPRALVSVIIARGSPGAESGCLQ